MKIRTWIITGLRFRWCMRFAFMLTIGILLFFNGALVNCRLPVTRNQSSTARINGSFFLPSLNQLVHLFHWWQDRRHDGRIQTMRAQQRKNLFQIFHGHVFSCWQFLAEIIFILLILVFLGNCFLSWFQCKLFLEELGLQLIAITANLHNNLRILLQSQEQCVQFQFFWHGLVDLGEILQPPRFCRWRLHFGATTSIHMQMYQLRSAMDRLAIGSKGGIVNGSILLQQLEQCLVPLFCD